MNPLKALITEIHAAEDAKDDPRRNRAVYALRLLYGVSFGEPYANYALYRPSESDLEEAEALICSLKSLDNLGGLVMRNEPSSNPLQLARRAVACKHWLWQPDMAAFTTEGDVVYAEKVRISGLPYALSECEAERVHVKVEIEDTLFEGVVFLSTLIPDLEDSVTKKAMLEMVQKAWQGDEWASVTVNKSQERELESPNMKWEVKIARGDNELALDWSLSYFGKTEEEALVAALRGAN